MPESAINQPPSTHCAERTCGLIAQTDDLVAISALSTMLIRTPSFSCPVLAGAKNSSNSLWPVILIVLNY